MSYSIDKFRHDSKILVISGSHGSDDGVSGLTDKSSVNVDEGFGFYREDCELLGIKPGPHKRSQRLPLTNRKGIPDVTKPAERIPFVREEVLMGMDIRIANICYYHDQEDKLIQDILQVNKCNSKNIVVCQFKRFIFHITFSV